jgi:hypothetical protein
MEMSRLSKLSTAVRSARRRAGAFVFLAAVFTTQTGYNECTGDVLHDPSFDVWCGDRLCSWQVEKGDIRKAPTWHEADLGVELVGDDVVLTQTSDVDAVVAPCVRFELVADIAASAVVTLEMDLYADGAAEFARELPASDWASLVYLVRMPGQYQGIRFRLSKSGGGRAVLGQIRARTVNVEECSGATPLEQPVVPLGGSCYSLAPDNPFAPDDGLCASGECSVTRPGVFLPYACGECESDGDCGEDLCGVEGKVERWLDPHRACVEPGSRVLGELCFGDGECATGTCCEGICSGCCPAAGSGRGCPDGRQCATLPVEGSLVLPYQCDPGERRGDPGEACLVDDDCASRSCAGGEELRVCPADGRRCEEDAECPPSPQGEGEGEGEDADEGGGDTFDRCVLIGTAGGSCQ